jgi:hypothetical protein
MRGAERALRGRPILRAPEPSIVRRVNADLKRFGVEPKQKKSTAPSSQRAQNRTVREDQRRQERVDAREVRPRSANQRKPYLPSTQHMHKRHYFVDYQEG